jgi:hypothetical protein
MSLALLYWYGPQQGAEAAKRIRTPQTQHERAWAMVSWMAHELDGVPVLYRVTTWSGGVTDTGKPVRALSSDFDGGMFRASWPFYSSVNGYIDENDVGGYRAQVDAWAFDAAGQAPASVSAGQQDSLQRSATRLLDAASPPRDYDADSVAAKCRVRLAESGELAFATRLPATTSGAPTGDLEVLLTTDLKPCLGVVDTVHDYYP